MAKKVILFLTLVLAGCASKGNENVSGIIKERYQAISSQLPVQNGNYTLIKASLVSDNTLQLLMMHTRSNSGSTAETREFLSGYARALCQDSESKRVLFAGGIYQLLLQEEGRSSVSLTVDKSSCNYD